jgi:hypothetical protein
MRRFMDGWRATRAGSAAIPGAIAALQVAVEAFEATVAAAREEGASNDDDLRQAAQRAFSELSESAPANARTFDRARAREDMRRFNVQVSGCAGAGCVIGLVWLALCVLQVYFVSEFIQQSSEWGAWPSAVAGFVLAFVPIIGNVLAFAGATQSGWANWLAALVFFAAPAATLVSGWSRWRRFGR